MAVFFRVGGGNPKWTPARTERSATINDIRSVVAAAAVEAAEFAKSSHGAAARAGDLILSIRDLIAESRKVLAHSKLYMKGTNGLRAINWDEESANSKLADTHIKDARERIQRQRHLIGRLAKHRHATDTAELILQTMLRTLQAMEGHRDIILARLDAR